MRTLKIGTGVMSLLLANMMIAVAMADGALDGNQEKPMIRRSPVMIAKKTRGGDGGDGGDASTEAAVMHILWWLKATQNPDGSWGNRKKIANTSLAVLTYLSHGEGPGSWSPYHNEFETVVSSGIEYIVSRIVFDESNTPDFYGTDTDLLMASYAIIEAYGMTRQPALREVSLYFLERIISSQSSTGGWGTSERDKLQYAGWAIQALKTAQYAGLNIKGLDECISKAVECLKTRHFSEGVFCDIAGDIHGQTTYTSVGCFALQILGHGKDAEVAEVLEYIRDSEPAIESVFSPIVNYYITQSKFYAGMRDDASKSDLEAWKKWNLAMKKKYAIAIYDSGMSAEAFVDDSNHQHRIGWLEHNSLDEKNRYIDTCLTALQLMVYYRYPVDSYVKLQDAQNSGALSTPNYATIREYTCAIVTKQKREELRLKELVNKAKKLLSEDPLEAVALLKDAINHGSIEAKLYLGRCYMKGDGVEKDRAKGLKLRVEAARAGYSQEYMELAKEAEKLGEVIIWCRLAMDAGLESGKNMLMWCLEVFLTECGEYESRVYESGKDEFDGAGAYKSEWKVSKEFCYRYFSEVVAKGASQYNKAFLGYCSYMMGRYTENGWACEPDKITALRWYYRAQAYGNEKAVRSGARLEENFSKSTVDAIKKKEGLYNLCKKPEDIEKDAIEAGKTTFALKGFYLGMSISDAKVMAEKYLPNSKVVIMENGTIEIDVTHKEEFDVHPMVFCKADDKGSVVRFNFDVRFLKQWFKYDVQDYGDWATQYGKEFCNLSLDRVEGARDLGDVSIAVSQEVYRHRDNKKKFVVSYFGKKTVFDPNGEQSFDDMLSNPNRVGRIEGVRAWVNNGWENGDGAKEGTLRVEILK